jgi:hypothetical protein
MVHGGETEEDACGNNNIVYNRRNANAHVTADNGKGLNDGQGLAHRPVHGRSATGP